MVGAGTVLVTLCGIGLIGSVIAAVHHAEVVAHWVGEPLGTLVLALAVTAIETSLIGKRGGREAESLAPQRAKSMRSHWMRTARDLHSQIFRRREHFGRSDLRGLFVPFGFAIMVGAMAVPVSADIFRFPAPACRFAHASSTSSSWRWFPAPHA